MTSKRAWSLADMVERRVALLGLLVDQHAVALRERAALDVLAGQAHGKPSRSSVPKASASAMAQSMPSPVSIIFLRVSRKRWIVRWTWKPVGTSVIFAPISFRRRHGDAGLAAPWIVDVLAHGLQAGPAAVEPVRLVGLVALRGLELVVELRAPLGRIDFDVCSLTTPSSMSFLE